MRKNIAQMEADSRRESYEERMSLKEELVYLEMMIERHKAYTDKIARECNLADVLQAGRFRASKLMAMKLHFTNP